MYKFLAVCGFGLGSSMVLKMSIEKAAKERGIDCEVENTDLSSAKGTTADAVFTSQELGDDLKGSTKAPSILFNDIWTKKKWDAHWMSF